MLNTNVNRLSLIKIKNILYCISKISKASNISHIYYICYAIILYLCQIMSCNHHLIIHEPGFDDACDLRMPSADRATAQHVDVQTWNTTLPVDWKTKQHSATKSSLPHCSHAHSLSSNAKKSHWSHSGDRRQVQTTWALLQKQKYRSVLQMLQYMCNAPKKETTKWQLSLHDTGNEGMFKQWQNRTKNSVEVMCLNNRNVGS